MLWWFERKGQRLHVEVLHLSNGGGYELRVFEQGDAAEHVEYFVNHDDLVQRQKDVMDRLIATGWSRSGEWLL